MPITIPQIRNTKPVTRSHLWNWVRHFTGVNVSHRHVCRDHAPPFDWFAHQWFDRPNLILILGSRGSGKSFLSAILTHLESRFHDNMGTRILGGSKAQSLQIYQALSQAIRDGSGSLGSDAEIIAKLLKTEATYRNGSQVSILAASHTSVRGPHVPSLRLDEVDEIDPDIREASLGMAMAMGDVSASISMTSTWHRLGGPMSNLMEKASNGEFPHYTTCTFDVLERCPESRSGSYVGGHRCYENCLSCPLQRWCHAERDRNGNVPLAKISSGHYAIESLIQKTQALSPRVFESDYLCKGPKADGVWFPNFDEARNVTEAAEYRPGVRVHLSIDSGVFTGAVFFQVTDGLNGHRTVNVFRDYLTENVAAESNALALRAIALGYEGGQNLRVSTDPAGGSRNPIGPTVIGEYEKAGLKRIERWSGGGGSVSDTLSLVEALILSADGVSSLLIHPRCVKLIQALLSYRRAKRANQWMDYPEDPQHFAEDMVDALRGGLKLEFPEGRRPARKFNPATPGGVIY